MRLIDADALKGYLQLALMVSDKLAKEQPDIGELVNTFMNGMITQIDAMPTADAIPVSFLESLRDNARSDEAAETITEILRLWDEEAKG